MKLSFQVSKQDEVEAEFNPIFIERLLPKLEWSTVYLSAEVVGLQEDLPKDFSDDIVSNQDILQKLHHLLLEVDILEGQLECPETGRVFPIKDGIPNMLLNEDEV